MSVSVLEFGDFRLDFQRYALSRAGRSVKLQRKPLELLILLANGRGRLVTRKEIADRLWGCEVFVDAEHGINTAVRKLRRASACGKSSGLLVLYLLCGKFDEAEMYAGHAIENRDMQLIQTVGVFLQPQCWWPKLAKRMNIPS